MLRARSAQFVALIQRLRENRGPVDAMHIHKLRVISRKIRVALGILTPPEDAESAKRMRKAAGRIRRAAGAIRDCDVHLQILRELERGVEERGSHAARPAGLADAIAMILQTRENAGAQLSDELSQFKPGRFMHIAERIAASAQAHETVSPGYATKIAADQARVVVGQMKAAASGLIGSAEAFHRLRLSIKSLRYARESLAVAAGERPKGSEMLAEIQTKLGDLNDVATLVDRLDGYAALIDLQHSSELLPPARQTRDGLRALANGFRTIFSTRAGHFATWWGQRWTAADLDSLAPGLVPSEDDEHAAGVKFMAADPVEKSHVSATEPEPQQYAPLRRTEEATEDQHHAQLWLAGRVLSVIDIGSNSVRLLVVELKSPNSWKVLAQERAMTRLAFGMSRGNLLVRESMERSADAVERFVAKANSLGCTMLRAFATAAMRDASNGGEFAHVIKTRTGVNVEIISAAEEGRLSHRSAVRRFELSDTPAAVADLGGGSLEVVHTQRGVVTGNVSMPLGALRVTEEFASLDPDGVVDLDAMREGVDRVLRKRLCDVQKRPKFLVGCGGTFTTLMTLMSAARGTPLESSDVALCTLPAVSRRDVKGLIRKLAPMTDQDRASVPGLPADRADIIVAGLVTVDRLMKRLRCNTLYVHSGGIREGFILKIIEELLDPVPGSASLTGEKIVDAARALATRCDYEKPHSEHVAKLSLMLYDRLVEGRFIRELGAHEMERSLLEAAAVLHDIGILVKFKGHHKHSYSIVMNNGLVGVDDETLVVLALICRYHRKRGPTTSHRAFALLSAELQNMVIRLTGILRVADGLDRSHAQLVRDINLSAGKRNLRVECFSDGMDISNEHDAAMEKADVLERILGMHVDVISRDGSGSVIAL
jgi:exopolyphosphatase/guanosine-5'-triphosphate,3'-diphosphate pyrophosphatase